MPSRGGLLGAVMLGLGRALGETMAVTMVIGNRPEISSNLLGPSHTIAAVIANEFADATSDLHLSAHAARGGIITGILLAVARIAGETAPLLFTSLNNQFWPSAISPRPR